jgi:hypothetical protein
MLFKTLDVLSDTVLQNREVVCGEAVYRLAGSVGNDNIQNDIARGCRECA